MKQDIKHKFLFKQTPQVVWDYLTKPELLSEWLMDNNFQLVLGHEFEFRNNSDSKCDNDGVAFCKVTEFIPCKLLSYSWSNGKNGNKTLDSIVTWKLFDINGGTELELHHSGFKLLEDFISHSKGWDKITADFAKQLNAIHHANTTV